MNAFLGTMYLFAGNYAPEGFALCNGQLLQISSNQALFSVFGATYGGDGMKTFGLPNMTSPLPGACYIIATNGIYPSRA
jgi:microcystin-dependent protein